MISQVNYFTEFKDETKTDVVMVLDEGKLVVKSCDMVDGQCEKEKSRMKYELACEGRLDDPAAANVSVKENIDTITSDPGVKLEDGVEFKFTLDHCLEVIYKEESKTPDAEPSR